MPAPPQHPSHLGLALARLDDAAISIKGSGGDLHSELIGHAARWLQKQNCAVIITDMAHGGSETPDAIGWRSGYGGRGAWSILIECKASRADFLNDKHKHFRREPKRGMGSLRYYLAPTGIIRPDDLPAKWGLLEWNGKKILETQASKGFGLDLLQDGPEHEMSVLISALRRVAHHAPAGISVKCYTIESTGRATLGTRPPDSDPDYSI